MFSNKCILLIAGGGTLGTKVAEELLRLGASVEVICPEEKVSNHPRLTFHQGWATEEYLREILARKHYHGIVNFAHYRYVEKYKAIHPLLIENTDHLIFLSSYRVYADEQHPITESAPRLTEVIADENFLENEDYSVPKARGEDYLRNERAGEPWTIIRPVISFSDRRLDLLMYSGHQVLTAAKEGTELLLPELAKDFTAGLDWSGNTGKLIANLLFKPEAIGETYSIYSGHSLTWGQVASIYQKLTGVRIRWCSEEEYLDFHTSVRARPSNTWQWIYDRKFNRDIDCTKVLQATGLGKSDFTSIEDAIKYELKRIAESV